LPRDGGAYLGRCLERALNASGLLCVDFEDLRRWDGWRICCRQSIQMSTDRLKDMPPQGIGPEWSRAQGLLLHVSLPKQAGLLEIEEVFSWFQPIIPADAGICVNTEFSSVHFLRVDALGFEKP